MDREDAEPLSIGIVLEAGLARRRWDDALTRLAQQVASARSNVQTPLNVNVVFYVPSKLLQLDWTGERTGRYSKKDDLLMVQVALPEEPPDDVDDYLRERLAAALGEAEEWARKRRVADDLNELRALVATL